MFCSAQVNPDAGSGTYEWMCNPGTYFCQSPGSCAQCLSDADCADAELPTYEPSRTRCDLDSGVAGYQGFCQRCVGNADCAGNGLDNQCDLDPRSVEPSIEAIGFETCSLPVAGCPHGTQPGIGGCVSTSCTTDSDCAGAVSSPNEDLDLFDGYSGQQAEPFCVNGQCANSPDDNELCPNCYCVSDSTCRDPQAICDGLNDHCACADSSQCGGPWPICQIPKDADLDDAGQPLGSCGCGSDADCGDAGLKCLTLPEDNALYGGPACLFACDDPRFPGCANLLAATPICDVPSGLCGSCETDQQCRTQAAGSFVGPFCRDDGICGCQVDSDCPAHEVCGGTPSHGGAGGLLGQCVAPPLRCTPASCPYPAFCDLDGGACEATASSRVCASDGDCAYSAGGAFCESDAGSCVVCRADSDCVALGYAVEGYSHCTAGGCTPGCAADPDCAGNPAGDHCVTSTSSPGTDHCGCGSDPDCAGNASGSHCETDAGTCGCASAADCSPGEWCYPGNLVCTQYCQSDLDCPAQFFCSELSTCLPRCDDGGGGCQAPFLACDLGDVQGGNGSGVFGESAPGSVWCYQCLTGDDCSAGQNCEYTACRETYCYGEHSCHTGEVCGADELCHASCDAGACPSGQICDVDNAGGDGFDLCQGCLSPRDCPGGQGCNRYTHLCGSCEGPTAGLSASDCPPDAICSDYWPGHDGLFGVCLQNCDVFACPNPTDICAVLPALTPDHKYCFGCLQDSDCGDAGARCDNSLGLTFTCQLPGAPTAP